MTIKNEYTMKDQFVNRHIGPSEADVEQMLEAIGCSSVDELISQVVPENIRLKKPLALPEEGMSEYEFAAHIRAVAEKNRPLRTFIGMGYYPNCSLLDVGTAAAEAMTMMFSLRSRDAVKEGRNQLFVDNNIFPQTLDVLLTRSEPFGIELVMGDAADYEFTGKEFGAIVQYPGADGAIVDYSGFAAKAHERGIMVTAVADILSLALLRAPGEWGADIVVGSTQRFGAPMAYGGPSAAYLATRDAYKRNMAGRIIGVSVDRLGNKALRMALQTREQHIKRDKATSNICTAQALFATMAGMFAVYHGPEGIRSIALHAHSCAAAVAEAADKLGFSLSSRCFFDTVEIEAEADRMRSIAESRGVKGEYDTLYTGECGRVGHEMIVDLSLIHI